MLQYLGGAVAKGISKGKRGKAKARAAQAAPAAGGAVGWVIDKVTGKKKMAPIYRKRRRKSLNKTLNSLMQINAVVGQKAMHQLMPFVGQKLMKHL